MLLKKQVRGGVLLYALFMAGIFILLLHVYLERVVASSRQNQAQMTSSQSRLMAEMTMDLADKEAGAFSFQRVHAGVFELADVLVHGFDLVVARQHVAGHVHASAAFMGVARS